MYHSPFQRRKSDVKRIDIRHTTHYGFSSPVRPGPHTLFLRPREGHDIRIVSSVLDIVPKGTLIWRRDLYDNVLAVVSFDGTPCAELTIKSRVTVELYDTMPLNFIVEPHALHFPFSYTPEERSALRPYLEPVYSDSPLLMGWLSPYRQTSGAIETFAVLDRMNHRIHRDFLYAARDEEGVLAPEDTLSRGTGSCRDLATLFIESCRRLGIAARFVSGYVHDPATEIGGASTHAWAEVYLPGAGWKGFDPTNAAIAGPDHIPVAVHRHPEALPPVAGSFTGPTEAPPPTLSVDVQIIRLPDLPAD